MPSLLPSLSLTLASSSLILKVTGSVTEKRELERIEMRLNVLIGTLFCSGTVMNNMPKQSKTQVNILAFSQFPE
jgi:hypothetical protein